MTRGQKGCYIYCADLETNLWFKSLLSDDARTLSRVAESYPGLTLRVLPEWEAKPYENCIPVYDLQVAAGLFSDAQAVGQPDWVEVPPEIRVQEGLFVTRVVGESMNRRIPNGSWCLFRAKPIGTRQGRIVLVQHQEIHDTETGGHYTVKAYHSDKSVNEFGEWEHQQITLKPDTTASGFEPIVLKNFEPDEFKILAEFVAVL